MNQSFNCIWDALEDTPQDAELMRLRTRVLSSLRQEVEAEGTDFDRIADRLDTTADQARDVQEGNIDRLTLDALVRMAVTAKLKIDLSVSTSLR